jgi:hypothetical protein
MLLLIENQGEAPIESFTVLGDSGTRHRDDAGLIGQFGSGNKHAVNVLLRNNIPFYIYLGKTKLEFYYEVKRVTEADGTVRESYPVKCRLSGDKNRTINCGWTLEFGALDWTKVSMAIREFVSNALDCSKIMGSEAIVKPEPNKRAKAGTTRIYIDFSNEAVKSYYQDLGKHFLHFSSDPSQSTETFLRKNPESVGPLVYFEGVLINELRATKASAFDYNFKKGEIRIDECRNLDEYALRARIAQLINTAPPEIIARFFEEMSQGEVYESTLDEFYLNYEQGEEQQNNWKEAWTAFAGDAIIATESMASSGVAQHVEAKGHRVKAVKSDAFVKAAKSMGVKDISEVIGAHAASGKIECDPTDAALEAVNAVWGWCEQLNMTNRKDKPIVMSFRDIMDGGGECLGYWKHGANEVFIRDDIAGKIALKTAMEEVAHYITGSGDNSRDFQNFLIDLIVESCNQEMLV